jgi:hypothetical protein
LTIVINQAVLPFLKCNNIDQFSSSLDMNTIIVIK